jgi:hypothetical protein
MAPTPGRHIGCVVDTAGSLRLYYGVSRDGSQALLHDVVQTRRRTLSKGHKLQ